MCGIAGAMSAEPTSESGRVAHRLFSRLRHRGPDDSGFWLRGPVQSGPALEDELDRPASVVLAHRRLSIVDVAEGHQPMSNETESVWVAFNGEIYNHEMLRAELVRLG